MSYEIFNPDAWTQIPKKIINELAPEVPYYDDIYFKYQKCLSGITYTYINQIEDIYKTDYLVSDDGISVYNMYTEYDIIDHFLKNLKSIDIFVNYNIETGATQKVLDNITLKPGHRILLMGQSDSYQNDIYTVDAKGHLSITTDLSTSTLSDKYKAYCKLGSFYDKQIFLYSLSPTFPISTELKNFKEYHSYIVKHAINYEMNNTGQTYTDCSKLVFTDYDVARKMNSENYSLYSGFTMLIQSGSTGFTLNINYHNLDYGIYMTESAITYTGYTNSGLTAVVGVQNLSGETWIYHEGTLNTNIGEYVSVKIYDSGHTYDYINYNNFIKEVYPTYFVLNDTIPNYILHKPNEIETGLTGMQYSVETLQYMPISTAVTDETYWIIDRLEKSYMSKFYNTTGVFLNNQHNISITPIPYQYQLYFDYDGLIFTNSGVSYAFTTYNNYINYQLLPFLSRISPIFNYNYVVYNESPLTVTSYETLSGTTFIKITNSSIDYTDYYRPYTYLHIYDSSAYTNSGVSLIYEVTNTYMVIELPSGYTAPALIANMYTLGDISEALYLTYLNIVPYLWYTSFKDDDLKKLIASAYGQILSEISDIQELTTGILYQENGKFLLKLFTYFDDDPYLHYTPIELIDIGVDKKTKLPIPINTTNIDKSTYTDEWLITASNNYYYFDSNNDISSLVLNTNGDICLAGDFMGWMSGFTTSSFTNNYEYYSSGQCSMILKLEPTTGDNLYLKYVIMTGFTNTRTIATDESNNIYIGGAFAGKIEDGYGEIESIYSGETNCFFGRYPDSSVLNDADWFQRVGTVTAVTSGITHNTGFTSNEYCAKILYKNNYLYALCNLDPGITYFGTGTTYDSHTEWVTTGISWGNSPDEASKSCLIKTDTGGTYQWISKFIAPRPYDNYDIDLNIILNWIDFNMGNAVLDFNYDVYDFSKGIELYDMQVDDSDNIYICGRYRGDVMFLCTSGTTSGTTFSGSSYCDFGVIFSLNSYGELRWANTIITQSSGLSYLPYAGVSFKNLVLNGGYICATGYIRTGATFGSIVKTTSEESNCDIFFARLDMNTGLYLDVTTYPSIYSLTGSTITDSTNAMWNDDGYSYVGGYYNNKIFLGNGITGIATTDNAPLIFATQDSTLATTEKVSISGTEINLVTDLRVDGEYLYSVGSFNDYGIFKNNTRLSHSNFISGSTYLDFFIWKTKK
jgi:hypothetical protein